MRYAYIESSTGIVWASSTKEFTVEDIAQNLPQVDSRRSDAPDNVQTKASNMDGYHRWTGYDYVFVWDILKLKIQKNEEINIRTQQIIANGINYDGRQFPLDLPDQSTWHGLFNAVAAGVATYPIKVMDTVDEPYYLADATAFQNMYFIGFGQVGVILESGRVLKAQVNACTTKEEIDAIVDDR